MKVKESIKKIAKVVIATAIIISGMVTTKSHILAAPAKNETTGKYYEFDKKIIMSFLRIKIIFQQIQ